MLQITKITQAYFFRELEGKEVSLLGYVKLPTANMADALSKFNSTLLNTETQNTGIFKKRSKDFFRQLADGQKSYGYIAGNVIFTTKSTNEKDCYFVINPHYYPNEPSASYAIVYRKEA